ncbi:SRPBCC family protein [Mycobacterium sp. CBMA271]|uniref:SRPBCC family protein n=1 Tax=unclassified Mycobacteroides TaxID=2618759 RepID=UPI0012DEBC37|nr:MULTISPECIES: SRPBCC family protein [unclassified Mycobacteroides]MUM17159.1 Immediate-early protein 2 [Mycobacteroides sp. CBMA 326]MUM23828.1 SRPBCC family protein [Mycobacteroides sp. CBMA 271]
MALLLIERTSDLPAEVAFARITDWPRHSEHIPLTTVYLTSEGPAGVGTAFVGRTGLGPIGFSDPMTVTAWTPPQGGRPGRCRLEKTGSLVLGWAEIDVYSEGAGSRVVWREDAHVRGTPRFLSRLEKAAGEWMFGRAIDRMLAD